MRRWLPQAALITWALAATVVAVQASQIVGAVEQNDEGQVQLERKYRALRREHAALEHWVVKELRPWLIHTAYEQSAALPSGVPTPSLAPLAPVPGASPSPAPSEPSSEVSPSPSGLPLPSLEPSPTCIPVVEICIGES